jgi:hypothetical protein
MGPDPSFGTLYAEMHGGFNLQLGIKELFDTRENLSFLSAATHGSQMTCDLDL